MSSTSPHRHLLPPSAAVCRSPEAEPTASWVASANAANADFPIANLPLAAMAVGEGGGDESDEAEARLATVIGDRVVDVTMLYEAGWFAQCARNGLSPEAAESLDDGLSHAAAAGMWNAGGLTKSHLRDLRTALQSFLADRPAEDADERDLRTEALSPLALAQFVRPVTTLNYTDFYASKHHARNVGSMFRPDNPLLPNYTHIPIGYHGRASSVVLSGTPVRRPNGQTRPDEKSPPVFGPCKRLDYELEMGCVIIGGNQLGSPVQIADAPELIMGFCLVNDWSARDMQAWEYQPLGPFLAKNFATSVSPLIVTAEALAPYRVPGPPRDSGDPAPLPYLEGLSDWGLDVVMEVHLRSAAMREKGLSPLRISSGNLREMFWTFPQMIAHHTCNGCNLLDGDLLASGTVSGPTPDSRGCMLELTWQGNGPDGKALPRKPLTLPTGETRTFLEDGDEVIMTAFAQAPGKPRIGFGSCTGVITP